MIQRPFRFMFDEILQHFNLGKDGHRIVIGVLIGLLVRGIWASRRSASIGPQQRKMLLPPDDSATSLHEEMLADGDAGIFRTLEVMAELVRRDVRSPAVRDVALRVVQHCKGHDFLCEIKAVYEYVRDEYTYRRDPVYVERVQDAKRTIERGASGGVDCDDKSVLLASLLAALGHKPAFAVLGKTRQQYSHVYVAVKVPGKGWLSLDPTPERAVVGWEGKGAMKQLYPIFR
jgi:hypothetical protein